MYAMYIRGVTGVFFSFFVDLYKPKNAGRQINARLLLLILQKFDFVLFFFVLYKMRSEWYN